MEQRIAYALGFDIANPPVRNPQNAGGFFGLESNVPSTLRGPEEGFVASILVRMQTDRYNGDLNLPVFGQFLAGSYDWAAQEGWAFAAQGGSTLVGVVGTTPLFTTVEPNKDVLVTIEFDGTHFWLYANGVEVGDVDVPGYVMGPDNFGIGGTPDPSYAAFFADDAYGAIAYNIGGLMVASPSFDAPNNVNYHATSSPPAEQFNAVMQASDMVDTPPSQIPGADQTGEFPQADYLWSVRRGLPNIVDGGNEVWADQVTGLELQRIGTPQGASVGSHQAKWQSFTYVLPAPPPPVP